MRIIKHKYFTAWMAQLFFVFWFGFMFYLIADLLEPGLISFYFNINILLILSFIFGFLWTFFE